MKKVSFSSYKVAKKLPLNKIASFFKIHKALSWKEYITIKGYHLDMILKYETEDKEIYLFDFGCITFVNFTRDEEGIFFEYLQSLIGKVNYDMVGRFHSEHQIIVQDNGTYILESDSDPVIPYNSDIHHLIAMVLAKSTALYKVELDVNALLDKTEILVILLQKGKLNLKSRKLSQITSEYLRFEYDIISNIGIFDRDMHGLPSSYPIYDRLSDYYELHDRFDILKSKIEDLRRITTTYHDLSSHQTEERSYLFEIFLLALFPLSHLLHYLI